MDRRTVFGRVLGLFAAVIFSQSALGHLTYPAARDFGTFSLELREFTITGQTTKSFSWADGTDADFGHQDDQRYLKFTLSTPQTVTISVAAVDPLTLLPAFSIYSGLGHAAANSANPDYDGAAVTQAYLATLGDPQPREGAFDALHTWKIGNDSDPQLGYVADLVTFTYMGHAADGTAANYGNGAGINGDGVANGVVTGKFALPAGAYTLVVGGADYASTDVTSRAFTATITNAPEPGGALMAGFGMAALMLNRRLRSRSRSTLSVRGLLPRDVRLTRSLLPGVVLIACCCSASAHLSYAGRNFGTFTGLELQSSTITGQTVPTNWGWADGTDADYGHTHRVRFFQFTLENTAPVTLSVVSLNPSAMLPAFSIYSGIGSTNPPAYESDATISYLSTLPGPAKEGAFNALATWKMGTDESTSFADFSTFTYVGHAADGTAANFGEAPGIEGDGQADGSITRTFLLARGSYTVVIGGATYSGQGSGASIGDGGQQGADIAADAITASIVVIPEPTGIFAALSGGMLLFARRRHGSGVIR